LTVLYQCTFAQFEKDHHIEKMHPAQDENDRTGLHTQLLDQLPRITDIVSYPQGINGISQVDQVKAYQQQIVNGLRQLLIAVKDVDQKDLPIPKKRAGYPDGKDYRNDQIKTVKNKNVRHKDNFEMVKKCYFIVQNFQ
jgi:hypothetical protein